MPFNANVIQSDWSPPRGLYIWIKSSQMVFLIKYIRIKNAFIYLKWDLKKKSNCVSGAMAEQKHRRWLLWFWVKLSDPVGTSLVAVLTYNYNKYHINGPIKLDKCIRWDLSLSCFCLVVTISKSYMWQRSRIGPCIWKSMTHPLYKLW